jgi:hypothetical protein
MRLHGEVGATTVALVPPWHINHRKEGSIMGHTCFVCGVQLDMRLDVATRPHYAYAGNGGTHRIVLRCDLAHITCAVADDLAGDWDTILVPSEPWIIHPSGPRYAAKVADDNLTRLQRTQMDDGTLASLYAIWCFFAHLPYATADQACRIVSSNLEAVIAYPPEDDYDPIAEIAFCDWERDEERSA